MKRPSILLLLFAAISIQTLTVCKADKISSELWLSIVATHKTLPGAVAEFRQLGKLDAQLNLYASNDCIGLVPDLYVVAQVENNRDKALANTKAWQELGISDAYVKHCQVAKLSRLALNIALIDRSFEKQKQAAVNWDLTEATSQVISLSETKVGIVRPVYQDKPDDIREGIKIGVFFHDFATSDYQTKKLSDNCINPEFNLSQNHLMLTCVTEAAANHLLHTTQVFSLPEANLLHTLDRCRSPSIIADRLNCSEEFIDAEGRLQEVNKERPLREALKSRPTLDPKEY